MLASWKTSSLCVVKSKNSLNGHTTKLLRIVASSLSSLLFGGKVWAWASVRCQTGVHCIAIAS